MKKNVIVTGARRGLGLSICHRLADDGYNVIAVARANSAELTSLCENHNVHYECFDLLNTGEIQSFVNDITGRHGRIFGLVNNAAIGNDGVLSTMHELDIERVLDVNLRSPIVLTKYVSRSMLLAGCGRIVNISSIIGTTGYSGLSVYAATKSGLIGFTKSLSRELGKVGITVNCVAPGYMQTDMTSEISPEHLKSIIRRSPMAKLATVDSVSGAVSYLFSDDGELITGTTLTVDAGSTA